MGVFTKIGSSFGFKQFSGSDASKKSSGGYFAGGQLPTKQTTEVPLASGTYLVPGSAAVLVSGSSMAKTVASLQPGEKILGLDITTGNAFTWATLQGVEVVGPEVKANKVILGIAGESNVLLQAEQVILARDRKKNILMQQVRRLEISQNAIVFNRESLQWLGKKAQEMKKISSTRLVRDMDSTEPLYKITLGSTNHSLLLSCALDAKHFLVLNATNSTVDEMKAAAACNKAAEAVEKLEVKNTLLATPLHC